MYIFAIFLNFFLAHLT